MDIYFSFEVPAQPHYQQLVEKVINAILTDYPNSEVNVTLTSDESMREINRQFRKIDAPTDCLSFPQFERYEIVQFDKDEFILLGDIVISLERAEQQAAEYNHSIERELAFLVAHSTLHLLGYDHTNPDDEKVMFSKQEEILESLGIRR